MIQLINRYENETGEQAVKLTHFSGTLYFTTSFLTWLNNYLSKLETVHLIQYATKKQCSILLKKEK